MGRILVIIGTVIVAIGALWWVGEKFFKFGRLPGDILIEREGFRLSFPLVTCLIISVLLTLIHLVYRSLK